MSQIVDIHSQFETHQLFNESYHLKLLDNFIGNELTDLKNKLDDENAVIFKVRG